MDWDDTIAATSSVKDMLISIWSEPLVGPNKDLMTLLFILLGTLIILLIFVRSLKLTK